MERPSADLWYVICYIWFSLIVLFLLVFLISFITQHLLIVVSVWMPGTDVSQPMQKDLCQFH